MDSFIQLHSAAHVTPSDIISVIQRIDFITSTFIKKPFGVDSLFCGIIYNHLSNTSATWKSYFGGGLERMTILMLYLLPGKDSLFVLYYQFYSIIEIQSIDWLKMII